LVPQLRDGFYAHPVVFEEADPLLKAYSRSGEVFARFTPLLAIEGQFP
jgi:hypothetical protein